MEETKQIKVAIAGASGFIGKKLIEQLTKNSFLVNALSRRDKSSQDTESVTWKEADLFSMLDIERAITECDIAIYLVHSMLPSAHLTQGSFDNLDLILADNFGRACKKKGIKQIIYLSGIIPESENLSDHLRSRLEVERTLQSYEIPLTTLRAGIIVGPGGSSSTMVINLVNRLPMMVLPNWTETLSNPIGVEDTIDAITECVDNPSFYNKTFDLGGPEILSYQDLVRRTALIMKKKRFFFSVPFLSQKLSKGWVSLITGAPLNLVTPLITSLKHHMVIDEKKTFPFKKPLTTIDTILSQCIQNHAEFKPHAYKYTGRDSDYKEVRSVQRLDTVLRSPADRVATLYMQWIPSFLKPFIKVEQNENTFIFRLGLIGTALLIMKLSPERSTPDRQLFYIRGGLLAYGEGRGRLEFRDVLANRYTLAAIHEFHPRLPWYIYKYTQALVHLWVMKNFNKALLRKKY